LFQQLFQIIAPRLIGVLAFIDYLHTESAVTKILSQLLPWDLVSDFAEVLGFKRMNANQKRQTAVGRREK
jgi:hypothetical protein